MLFAPLTLPNGATIANRLAKAAMEETLADAGQLPGPRIERLYRRWAEGGTGLIITGNVMVDRRALTGPGTIALEAGTPLEPFKAWARAIRAQGAQAWMQISHPGRQVMASMGGLAWAPGHGQHGRPGVGAVGGGAGPGQAQQDVRAAGGDDGSGHP